MATSAERPLAELLGELSERSPAPGAGSGAGWTGAMAAALLEMTAAFAGADSDARRAPQLRAELLSAAEADLRAYEPVLDALRLDAEDPDRRERLHGALSQATESPLRIARAAAEVAELAAGVADRSTRELRGDAATAVLLAEAAARAAGLLVELNLAARPGDPRLEEAARLCERAAAARDQVLGAQAEQ